MRVVKFVVDVLIYAACAIGVATLILMLLNYKMVSIKTGSMEPTINIGDLCLVHEVGKSEEYRQGDIVTFLVGDVYVTHRIASDNGDGTYVTMGDANKVADSGSLEKEDILGKVIVTVPVMGFFLEYITNPNGKLVVVVGVVLLVTLSLLLENVAGKKKVRNKEREENKTAGEPSGSSPTKELESRIKEE